MVRSKNNQQKQNLSNIETIKLNVANNSIKEMASNLPESAKKQYYPAKLLYPNGEWKMLNLDLEVEAYGIDQISPN